jgi:hypothetical protein
MGTRMLRMVGKCQFFDFADLYRKWDKICTRILKKNLL